MTEIDKLLRSLVDDLMVDIKQAYERSNRKVSGQWARGLTVKYEPYKATIYGYDYLAGRGATKKAGVAGEPTLRERIEQWMEQKGIAAKIRSEAKTPKAQRYKVRSVAYAIAKKIHEKGTDSSKWWQIYQEIITPERIDLIIDKIGQLNTQMIVNSIELELELLAKNA